MAESFFEGGINSDLERIMQHVYSHYSDKIKGSDVRAYEFGVDSELEWEISRMWKKRYLGNVLPPSHKIDGTHPSEARAKRTYSYAWDGVWDFTAEYNALLVRVCGLNSDDGARMRPFTYVLTDSETDVRPFRRYLDRLTKLYNVRHRHIVAYGSSTPSMKVKVDPADVFLAPGVREALLAEAQNFIAGEQWYKQNGLPWKRSILLYGPPGTGKTTVAKMIASTFLDRKKQAFAMVIDRKTDFADVSHVFRMAKDARPALLILEDLDAIQQSDVGRSAFLNLLDGSGDLREGTFLIGTTNFPEALDPALANRPGRWDRLIEVGLPSADARRACMARKWTKTPREHLIPTLVVETQGLTLANLAEIHYQVMMLVLEGGTPTEADIRRITREMRQISKMTDSGNWDKTERRVGFGMPSAAWGTASDEASATAD